MTTAMSQRLLCVIAALSALTACSDLRPLGDNNIVYDRTVMIDVGGGSIHVAGARLWVPPGAVPDPTRVTLRQADWGHAPQLGDMYPTSMVYEVILPSTLLEPAVLRIEYGDQSDGLFAIPSCVEGLPDTESREMVATVDHSAFFVLVNRGYPRCAPGECECNSPDCACYYLQEELALCEETCGGDACAPEECDHVRWQIDACMNGCSNGCLGWCDPTVESCWDCEEALEFCDCDGAPCDECLPEACTACDEFGECEAGVCNFGTGLCVEWCGHLGSADECVELGTCNSPD